MSQEKEGLALFCGTWSLVSWKATPPDGKTIHPFGEDAQGRIMYDSKGYMAAHLMRRHRTSFASHNPLDSTVDECYAAYREYFSYYGSYTVQQSKGTVAHHVEGSSFPNWVGRDQVRSFRIC